MPGDTPSTRSAYYAWVAGAEAREARRRADEALAHQITVIHIVSRRNYGVPRVTAELRRQGRPVNHKRVARVMRESGIAGNGRRTGRRSLAKADTKAAPSPDPIGRDFTAARPGTKIVGDITYIPTAEGWLYLASWLDLATREIIGYSMADHHRAGLVVDALDMAASLGRLEPGCVIHSDRGSEYTSGNSATECASWDRQSMRRTGSWSDNAAAESFWAVLKEEIGTRFWPDRATARADIFDFTETFYNRRRPRKHIHWATSHPTKPACATDESKPTRRNNNVFKIMGKLHLVADALQVALVRLLERSPRVCQSNGSVPAVGSPMRRARISLSWRNGVRFGRTVICRPPVRRA
ncbi:IS3 family transposase [Streptomyces sp. NPDC029721]|uniref:IS3 family transposase n=1 Tax=Streptomyces sp. NPDC029721 TaxID=3157090 RepID=UPI00340CB2A3